MDYQALLLNLCELFIMDDAGMDDDILIHWIMNMGDPSIYNIYMMKDRGNSLFKEGNLSLAVSLYKQALQFFCFLGIPCTRDQQTATSLALSLVLNLAACELKLSHYNQAWCYCNLILNFDLCNVKAFYRRGLAFQKLHFLVEALDDFEHALKLDQNNKDVARELHYVVDCLALKPNGKRAAYLFDPLRQNKQIKAYCSVIYLF
ncbi:peptidyl-prolyl cis-trans isomerase FKBP62-like [Silene latifolia]|uniref:peptidyl-prolyl cis-trans isomerase FKBP62-like n=1 Tax=Silene latifolia TaxID=37657 RepID=UPI003D77B984